jgi:hypothetical protein
MCDEEKKMDETVEEVKDTAEKAADAAEAVDETVSAAAEKVSEKTENSQESIEKTVEDLRRKIKEISVDDDNAEKEDEPKLTVDFKLNDEQKAKIEEIRENTMKSVNETISEVKHKADEITASPDIQKTISFLKANAIKAVDIAKAKIEEIRENPDFQKTIDTAEDKAREFGETAKKTVDGLMTEERLDEIKKNIAKAEEAVSSGVDSASKAINEFVKKPEVQETIDKTVATAKEVADKGVNAINNLLNKKSDGE